MKPNSSVKSRGVPSYLCTSSFVIQPSTQNTSPHNPLMCCRLENTYYVHLPTLYSETYNTTFFVVEGLGEWEGTNNSCYVKGFANTVRNPGNKICCFFYQWSKLNGLLYTQTPPPPPRPPGRACSLTHSRLNAKSIHTSISGEYSFNQNTPFIHCHYVYSKSGLR